MDCDPSKLPRRSVLCSLGLALPQEDWLLNWCKSAQPLGGHWNCAGLLLLMKRPVRVHGVGLSYVHARGILGVWGNMDYSKESIAGEWRKRTHLD